MLAQTLPIKKAGRLLESCRWTVLTRSKPERNVTRSSSRKIQAVSDDLRHVVGMLFLLRTPFTKTLRSN